MTFRFYRSLLGKGLGRGFTLVEAMVVMAIMGLLTTVVVTQHSDFNSSTLLKNQAFELALGIREVQTLAVNNRATSTNVFRQEYGVYVTTDDTDDKHKQYILWQDDNDPTEAGDRRYDAGEEIGDPVRFDRRFQVYKIYADCKKDDFTNCPSSTEKDEMSISFARPNFDAFLKQQNATSSTAHIVITPVNDTGVQRAVYVSETGIITVQ